MNAFIEDWRGQVRKSVVDSAEAWLSARDVNLIHGLLPVAILWPIRPAIKDYDTEAINAAQEIMGENSKYVLREIQTWEDDRLEVARHLAALASDNSDLSKALISLNTYFDSVPIFANGLAQKTVALQGSGNVYNLSGQISAGLLNVGGEMNIDSLTLNINQPLSQAELADQQHLRNLLKQVKEIWINGVLANSLHNKVMIELRKGNRIDSVDCPWEQILEAPSGRKINLSAGRHIRDIFDDLGYTMLILGTPGSGKTTMLLELARVSIEHAEKIPGQPIPVVFNLSSWATRRQPLAEWLVEELNSIYKIPTKLGRNWIEQNVLLLLLDGLDEVKTEHRAACVEAINAFRVEHGVAYMAVCSRVGEYDALAIRLKLNGALILLPLTPEQIDEYFTKGGSKFDTARTILKTDPALQELVSSPLMLSVLALAYADEPIQSIQNIPLDSVEATRAHLFKIYVNKMLLRRKRGKHYSDNKTLRWMQWLALQMQRHSQSTFLIERLQPTWLPVFWQRRLFKLIQSDFVSPGQNQFIVGAAILLGILIFLAELVQPLLVLALPVAAVLILAVLLFSFGLMFQYLATRLLSGRVVAVETLYWSWGNLRKSPARVARAEKEKKTNWLFPIVGLLFFFIVGTLLLILRFDTWYLALFALVMIILGFIVFLKGLEFGQLEMTRMANEGIQRSIRNATIVGLWGGLAMAPMALFLGNIFGGWLGLGSAWLIGLGIVLFIGLWGWLSAGGWAFINHFLLRLLIWKTGCLPWDIASFLDYAADHIFLQKIGGGYIFSHRLLMEYFANLLPEKEEYTSVPVNDWLTLINLSKTNAKTIKAPLDEFLEENPWARLFLQQGGILSLFNLLYRASWVARVQAASGAVRLGLENGELVDTIFSALKDEDEDVKKQALSAIKELGINDHKLISNFLLSLDGKEDQLGFGLESAIIEKMEKEGKKSVAPLLTSLGHGDRSTRVRIVDALVEIGEKNDAVISELITYLRNEDSSARAGAAIVLGEICHKYTKEVKQAYLKNLEKSSPILALTEQTNQIVVALRSAYADPLNSRAEIFIFGDKTYDRVKFVIMSALDAAGAPIYRLTSEADNTNFVE